MSTSDESEEVKTNEDLLDDEDLSDLDVISDIESIEDDGETAGELVTRKTVTNSRIVLEADSEDDEKLDLDATMEDDVEARMLEKILKRKEFRKQESLKKSMEEFSNSDGDISDDESPRQPLNNSIKGIRGEAREKLYRQRANSGSLKMQTRPRRKSMDGLGAPHVASKSARFDKGIPLGDSLRRRKVKTMNFSAGLNKTQSDQNVKSKQVFLEDLLGREDRGVDYEVIYELLYLAHSGNTHDLRMALQSGRDPNIMDQDNNTALHHAVLAGQYAAVDLLLNFRETEVESVNLEGDTPLDVAARENHVRIINLLIQKGRVKLNRKRNDGSHVMEIAAPAAKQALKKQMGYEEQFFEAVASGDGKKVRSLLGHVNVNCLDPIRFRNGLWIAAKKKNNMKMVKLLVGRSIRVDKKLLSRVDPMYRKYLLQKYSAQCRDDLYLELMRLYRAFLEELTRINSLMALPVELQLKTLVKAKERVPVQQFLASITKLLNTVQSFVRRIIPCFPYFGKVDEGRLIDSLKLIKYKTYFQFVQHEKVLSEKLNNWKSFKDLEKFMVKQAERIKSPYKKSGLDEVLQAPRRNMKHLMNLLRRLMKHSDSSNQTLNLAVNSHFQMVRDRIFVLNTTVLDPRNQALLEKVSEIMEKRYQLKDFLKNRKRKYIWHKLNCPIGVFRAHHGEPKLKHFDLFIFSDSIQVGLPKSKVVKVYKLLDHKVIFDVFDDLFRLKICKRSKKVVDLIAFVKVTKRWVQIINGEFFGERTDYFSSRVLLFTHFGEKRRVKNFIRFDPGENPILEVKEYKMKELKDELRALDKKTSNLKKLLMKYEKEYKSLQEEDESD